MPTATLLRAVDLIQQAGIVVPRLSGKGHVLLPHQIPPPEFAAFLKDIWFVAGGRGCGKTETGSTSTLDHLREAAGNAGGRPISHSQRIIRPRVGIGAPTYSDCRHVCAEGETGLITLAEPGEFPVYNRGSMEAWHRDGGHVRWISGEEPNRWNGPQWTWLWWDELSLCAEESWHQSMFGLRLGPHPQCIATFTPKNRAFIKKLYKDPRVVVTRATTFDNPGLADVVKNRLQSTYAGTRLARQELMGEDVEDIEGALWQSGWIDSNRRTLEDIKDLVMPSVVVAVDPAGAHGERNDQTGIACAALGLDGEYYVLHVEGVRLSPQGWAQRAVDIYDTYEADMILGEVNNGGEMVEHTMRTVRPLLNVKTIHASRGKTLRAEPIASLFEKGVVHMVGIFPEAEAQMCSFPIASEHDDMVDALVYAITELAERTGYGMVSTGGPVEIWRRSPVEIR